MKNCPSPENPCMCSCHPDDECSECKMGRHKPKNMEQKPKWEAKFQEKFPHKIAEVIDDFGSTTKSDIQDYISSLLQRQKEEIVKKLDYLDICLEGMPANDSFGYGNVKFYASDVVEKLKEVKTKLIQDLEV